MDFNSSVMNSTVSQNNQLYQVQDGKAEDSGR